MSDVTIVEVFGIEMEDRCASLLRIVVDRNVIGISVCKHLINWEKPGVSERLSISSRTQK